MKFVNSNVLLRSKNQVKIVKYFKLSRNDTSRLIYKQNNNNKVILMSPSPLHACGKERYLFLLINDPLRPITSKVNILFVLHLLRNVAVVL